MDLIHPWSRGGYDSGRAKLCAMGQLSNRARHAVHTSKLCPGAFERLLIEILGHEQNPEPERVDEGERSSPMKGRCGSKSCLKLYCRPHRLLLDPIKSVVNPLPLAWIGREFRLRKTDRQ
jgi:hypothetical protein